MDDTFLFLFVAGYLIALVPLLVMASSRKKAGAVILCGIFLGPLIGWIVYALMDPVEVVTHGRKKKVITGLRSEDPLDAWERKQRTQAAPARRSFDDQ